MNADPIDRIQVAFGEVLFRRRHERKLSAHALANAAGLAAESDIITGLERGDFGPTLKDFFRIACALGEEPVVLFTDVVAAWRADPTDLGLYKSRASDLAKLYRLGYHHDAGDFRELPRTYSGVDEAMGAARILNATRRSKRQLLLDTVLIYVRLGSKSFRADAG